MMSTALDYQGAGAPQGSTHGNLIFPSLPHSLPYLRVGKPVLFFKEKMPEPALAAERACSQRRWTNIGNPWLSKKAAAWFPRFPQPGSPGFPSTHQTFPRKTRAHHLPGLPETASVLAPTTSSQHSRPLKPPSYCARRKRKHSRGWWGQKHVENRKKQEGTGGNVLNLPNF